MKKRFSCLAVKRLSVLRKFFLLFICLIAYLPNCASFVFPWFSPEKSKNFQEMSRRVRTAMENRQWHEALMFLEQGRRRHPQNGKIRLALAYLYRQVGLNAEAREHSGWASRHLAGESRDLAFRELAWANRKLYLHEEALDALGQIRARTSADWALEARIRMDRGEWPGALGALEHIQTPVALVSFWKGWCFWQTKDYGRARPLLLASGFDAARSIFEENFFGRGRDSWAVLGRMVARHQAGPGVSSEEMSRFALLGPADPQVSKSEHIALELIERLAHE